MELHTPTNNTFGFGKLYSVRNAYDKMIAESVAKRQEEQITRYVYESVMTNDVKRIKKFAEKNTKLADIAETNAIKRAFDNFKKAFKGMDISDSMKNAICSKVRVAIDTEIGKAVRLGHAQMTMKKSKLDKPRKLMTIKESAETDDDSAEKEAQARRERRRAMIARLSDDSFDNVNFGGEDGVEDTPVKDESKYLVRKPTIITIDDRAMSDRTVEKYQDFDEKKFDTASEVKDFLTSDLGDDYSFVVVDDPNEVSGIIKRKEGYTNDGNEVYAVAFKSENSHDDEYDEDFEKMTIVHAVIFHTDGSNISVSEFESDDVELPEVVSVRNNDDGADGKLSDIIGTMDSDDNVFENTDVDISSMGITDEDISNHIERQVKESHADFEDDEDIDFDNLDSLYQDDDYDDDELNDGESLLESKNKSFKMMKFNKCKPSSKKCKIKNIKTAETKKVALKKRQLKTTPKFKVPKFK